METGVTTSQIKKILSLIEARQRGRWVFLIALAVVVGVVETLGAFLILGLLGLITSPATTPDVPILGDVRSRFGELSDNQFLLWSAALVAAFFLFRAFVFLTQSYLQNRVAQNAGERLSARLLNGYLRMPYSFHLRRNSSELIRNANTSVLQIVTFAFVPLVLLVSESLLIVGLLAALVIASPASTLLVIGVTGPVILVLLLGIRRGMRSLGATNQEMSKTTLQALQESLGSVRDIQVLGLATYFEERFARSRARLARALYLRGVLADVPRVATETMLVVLILVFLIVAISAGDSVQDSLALLGLFGYAGVRLLPSLSRIVGNVNNLQFAEAAVSDIYAQIQMFEQHERRVESSAPLAFEREIVVADVSFSYDGNEVLSGVSFSLPRTSSLGIVGPTGAGKSTLVDIMMALIEPTKGRVLVDGAPIHEYPRAWQQHLGIVPQTIVLIDDSLRRNIAFGVEDAEIQMDRLLAAIEEARLTEFVSSLPEGLETVVGERGVRLSGGQRQRVAIARALYRNPNVLIFDEATSALDNLTEASLIENLHDSERGRTVISVAHRLTSVRHCSKIIVLDQGHLVDEGSYEELLERNPLFQAMG